MDISGPLRSLRDTLRSLHARIADDFGRADRAIRLMLKVNELLQAGSEANDSVLTEIRERTEMIANLSLDDLELLDNELRLLEHCLADVAS